MNKQQALEWLKKYTMIIVLVLVVIFFNFQTEGKMLLPSIITNVIAQNAYVFILAVGMLLCILTGGNIDLSVGSVVCFVGAAVAVLMVDGVAMPLIIALALVLGLAIGALQGFWIAYVRIPPFIVTLAGMLTFRGLSNVVLGGYTLSISKYETFIQIFGGGANAYFPDILGGDGINMLSIVVGVIAAALFIITSLANYFTRKKKGFETGALSGLVIKTVAIAAVILYFFYKFSQNNGIPIVLAWVAIVVGLYTFLTGKTTIGRHLYAVGGNEKATKLSGINTNNVYFFAYTNMGLLCGLVALITIARMGSAQPTYGDSYEMDAIGACYIGGASAYGGIGTVPGVIVGALLLGVLNTGMTLMGVDQNAQKVVKGVVLLAAVIFDVVSKRKKG